MKLHRVAYSNLGHNRPWNGVREVDYDTHPTGIIRLAGPNGAGKSTLLSLSGPALLYLLDPNQGDVRALVNAGHAWGEIEASIGGHRYLARVDFERRVITRGRNKGKETVDVSYLLRKDGDVVADNATAYKTAVREAFGSSADFFAIAYQAQRTAKLEKTAASFIELGSTERGEMFTRYLGLAPIEQRADLALAEQRAGEKALDRLRPQRERLDALAARVEELSRQRATQQQAVAVAQEALQGAEAAVDSATARAQEIQTKADQARAAADRTDDLLREQRSREASEAAVERCREALERARATAIARREDLEEARRNVERAKLASADVAQAQGYRQDAVRAVETAERERLDAERERNDAVNRERRLQAQAVDAAEAVRRAEAAVETAEERLDRARAAVEKAAAAVDERHDERNEARDAHAAALTAAREDRDLTVEAYRRADAQLRELRDAAYATREAEQRAVAATERAETALQRATERVRDAEAELKRLRQQAGYAGEVPCRGEPPFNTCQALAAATRAAAELPARKAAIAEFTQAAEQADAALAAAKQQHHESHSAFAEARQAGVDFRPQVDAAQEARDLAERRVRDLESLNAVPLDETLVPRHLVPLVVLRRAEAALAGAEREAARSRAEASVAEREIAKARTAIDAARRSTVDADLATAMAIRATTDKQLTDATAVLEEARRKLASIPEVAAEALAAVTAAESRCAAAERDNTQALRQAETESSARAVAEERLAVCRPVDTVAAELEDLAGVEPPSMQEQADVDQAKHEAGTARADAAGVVVLARTNVDETTGAIRAVAQEQAELAPVAEEIHNTEADVALWKTLRSDLQRLIGLKIEASAQGITDRVNAVLEGSFGGRFRVDLEVESPNATNEGVTRTYDVYVLDVENGSRRLLEQFSGGQQVPIGQALRLGLALFANETGIVRGTLYLDEADAAVGLANKGDYQVMLRRCLEILRQSAGTETRILVTSHTEDFICDHEIDVSALWHHDDSEARRQEAA